MNLSKLFKLSELIFIISECFLALWAIVRLNETMYGYALGRGRAEEWVFHQVTHLQRLDELSSVPVRIDLQDLKGSPNCQTCNSHNPSSLWMSPWGIGLFIPYSCTVIYPYSLGLVLLFQGCFKILIEIHLSSTNPILSPNVGFGFINLISDSCPLP